VNQPELPENIRLLIRACVPDIDALEVLVLLVRQPGAIPAAALHDSMRSPELTVRAITQYLEALVGQGLAEERQPGVFAYAPASGQVAESVAALLDAYERRPVTLIRTVYEIADSRNIQSLADAFRLRKNPP
jgi:hypothetical protein